MENKSLKLIQAVAAGDATREDVVAALKAEGVDALDILIDVFASVTRGPAKSSPLNFFDSKRASREKVKSVHQVPYYPVMLNGTLYDPADIKRFDGQELHFIGGSPNSPILAIDDREVVDLWVKHTYINTVATTSTQSLANHLAEQLHGYGISPTSYPHTTTPSPIPSPNPPPIPFVRPGRGGSSPDSGPPRTIFFEDINWGGSDLELRKDRGYSDLTDVSWTFLGTGDWNDEISSFLTTAPMWVRLWEHIHSAGSSFTLNSGSTNLIHLNVSPYLPLVYSGCPNLAAVGWNDRASSVETW